MALTRKEARRIVRKWTARRVTAPVSGLMTTEGVRFGRKAADLFDLEPTQAEPVIQAAATQAAKMFERRGSLWVPTFRAEMQAAVSDWMDTEERPSKAGLRRVITRFIRTYARTQLRTVVTTESAFAGQQILHALVKLAAKEKVWISQRDGRVRDSHVLLDGQRRKHGVRFRIPGTTQRAMFPGDFATDRENINCRCASVPYSSTLDPAEVWGKLNRFMRTWEQRLSQRIRRSLLAIRAQAFGTKALIDALDGPDEAPPESWIVARQARILRMADRVRDRRTAYRSRY